MKQPKNKYNLILDLDETLIQSVNFPSWLEDDTSKHLNPLVSLSFPVITNKQKYFQKKESNPSVAQIYCRPYLLDFLNFCFENFNVSIWTTSSEIYCLDILNFLQIKNKCKYIFVRKSKPFQMANIKNMAMDRVINKEEEFIEVNTKKVIQIKRSYRDSFKPMDNLWNNTFFNKTFNSNNTFMIDDRAETYINYPDNTILIPAWCHLNWEDNFLKFTMDKISNFIKSPQKKNIERLCIFLNKSYQLEKNWKFIDSQSCRENSFKPEFYFNQSAKKNKNFVNNENRKNVKDKKKTKNKQR
jgi:hypothetical protein